VSGSVLLIDDDALVRMTVARALEARGWQVRTAPDGRTGIELHLAERADVVVTDLSMPGLAGQQVIEILRARDPDVVIVVLTGNEQVDVAVEALRLGAENFLAKPVDHAHLAVAVERAAEKGALRRRARPVAGLAESAVAASHSPIMRQALAIMDAYARSTAPVLLSGETGSGKAWAARRIHAASPVATGPFVTLHCAGLAAEHHGVELVGTDAGRARDAGTYARGALERAQGGTLLLESVDELAPPLQARLAAILAQGHFVRVGGSRAHPLGARIVATTRADPAVVVRAGRLHAELHLHLAVLPLSLPPLRDRGAGEIAHLAQRAAAEACARANRPTVLLGDEALAALARHRWPGNVRELQNVVARAVVVARDAPVIELAHLPPELHPSVDGEITDAPLTLRAVERAHVLRVLALCGDNKRRAAQCLGITRATLYARLAEYGVHVAGGGAVRPRG
jgi:DNA-binding NtrC family response regulator